MNYILVSVLGYGLNAISILANKFLLTKKIPHPISYVFYISVFSLVALLLFPWTHLPSSQVILLASVSTLLWTAGAYFLFSALKIGLADRVAPIVGTLNPVFLIIYYYIFTSSISLNEVWGALFAIVGLVVIVIPFLKDRTRSVAGRNKGKELIFEVISALLFAVSYIFLKEVYTQTDFITGLVYSRFVLIPLAAMILAVPPLKRLVFSSNQDKINLLSKTGALFISGQVAGGASQLLITFAIFLANPALVNSLQGVQYVILFFASIILSEHYFKIFNEPLTKRAIYRKLVGIVLIGFGLYILAFAYTHPQHTTLGVTYSPRYAASLGLNPKVTFIQMLNDLNPKTVRLPIYWDQVEPKKGKFDFSVSDYYVKQLERNNVQATLVIGMKVPRFPECYIPSWVDKSNSSTLDSDLYDELKAVVSHYKDSPSLSVWQVENEPLFPFGVCPNTDFSRLKTEVAIVHLLDPNHPVMVTESGEFGLWLTTASISDIVGTTLYRRTLAPYIPQFKSPLPPFFYQFKGEITDLFFPNRKIYVSELQAEPWANQPLNTTSIDYQLLSFPVGDLKENVEFCQEAGFDTIYLWGVEWWYYLKKLGHPEYLNSAILIFNDIK